MKLTGLRAEKKEEERKERIASGSVKKESLFCVSLNFSSLTPGLGSHSNGPSNCNTNVLETSDLK